LPTDRLRLNINLRQFTVSLYFRWSFDFRFRMDLWFNRTRFIVLLLGFYQWVYYHEIGREL